MIPGSGKTGILMNRIKTMLVFGTRPEAIKMAPLLLEMKKRPEFDCCCCVTAQHREMLDSVLDIFKIVPDYDLDIMRQSQSLEGITTRALCGLADVLGKESPDLVLVHGDTSTTFAGALAAFYAKTKIGHVEAGLRTYDKYSPFPEEMNRTLTGRLADIHFCPTAANAANLRAEGIKDNVFVTGNTVIDAMKYTVSDSYSLAAELAGKRMILMTCHRRENYGEPMRAIFRAVKRIAEDFGDVTIVYPVHLSPEVQRTAHSMLDGTRNIKLIEPVSVVEMHNLMARCYMVMTDSGGLQEEAPALGKPVIVLRKETERPEAVKAGTVKIAGVEEDAVYSLAEKLLADERAYTEMAKAVNPYGDGKACERIADAVEWYFGIRGEKPADFR